MLPPTINFLLIVIGLLLFNKFKKCSRLLLFVGVLSLVIFSFPPFSHFFIKGLEQYPPLGPTVIVNNEQAIVVLSGGSYPYAKEYGKPIDGAAALERNHYAAFLYRETNLPILVSGGYVASSEISEASVMADTLINSFDVPVKWQETRSRNTAENAIYSVEILKQNNIHTIYLVTHAWHMARAVMMFKENGINVTPAPTIFTQSLSNTYWANYLPTASALQTFRLALHEYIGILWYKLRY